MSRPAGWDKGRQVALPHSGNGVRRKTCGAGQLGRLRLCVFVGARPADLVRSGSSLLSNAGGNGAVYGGARHEWGPAVRSCGTDSPVRNVAPRLWRVLEDPGRFYWKWIAVAVGLLVLYAVERTIRTGGLF